jgi:SnoaL-like protein
MSVDAFRKAAEAKDLEAAIDCFTEDAQLHSPVLFRPFEGKPAVKVVLGTALSVFEDFRYTDELRADEAAVLVFRARVGEREVEGIDLLRLAPDGRIADFTVMIRPLQGLTAFSAAMAANPDLAAAVAQRA